MILSDITICRNNKNGLIKTLNSFLEQTFKDFEVVVIDGNSTDGTKELLELYKAKFDEQGIGFKFLSEEDKGIYDAMNKGITLADGEWYIFMNSGDTLYDNKVLYDVYINLNTEELVENADIIYGDTAYLDDYSEVLRVPPAMSTISKGTPFSHQASFIRATCFKERNYDSSLQIAGSYDWFLYSYYIKERRFCYIHRVINIYDFGGVSSKELAKTYREVLSVRKRYGISDNFIFSKIKLFIWKILELLKVNPQRITNFNTKLNRKREKRIHYK